MKRRIIIVLLAALLCGIVLAPAAALQGALSGIDICMRIVAPSLLPFLILIKLLTDSGFVSGIARRLGGIMSIFRLPKAAVFAFIMGIISGYPVGAKCATLLYEQRLCSKQETERIVALCNNSGPLFIIGAVGVGIYSSRNIGWILYIVHILSALLTGLVLRLICVRVTNTAAVTHEPYIRTIVIPLNESLPSAVRSGVETVGVICGYIIFFCCVSAILRTLGITQLFTSLLSVCYIPPDVSAALVDGLLEVTQGVSGIATVDATLVLRLAVTSAILAWSGLSIMLQTQGIIQRHGLNMRIPIMSKLLQSIIAYGLTVLLCG